MNERILLLDLLQVLKTHTDKDNKLTQHEIIKLLKKKKVNYHKEKPSKII